VAVHKFVDEQMKQHGWPLDFIKSWWQCDHIMPVIEGGGEASLEGLRTLCHKCHQIETRALRQRMKERKANPGSKQKKLKTNENPIPMSTSISTIPSRHIRRTEECVLTVPTRELHALGLFQGFTPEAAKYLTLLESPNLTFTPRSQAEQEPSLKQLIPYVLIERAGQWYSYQRTARSGESRLYGKTSVGLGGHINDDDLRLAKCDPIAIYHQNELGEEAPSWRDAYNAGVRREIDEEIRLVGVQSHHVIGFINDDSNPVGSVHLGVVHLIRLHRTGGAELKEDSGKLLEIDIAEAYACLEFHNAIELETWTRFLVESRNCIHNIHPDITDISIPFPLQGSGDQDRPNN